MVGCYSGLKILLTSEGGPIKRLAYAGRFYWVEVNKIFRMIFRSGIPKQANCEKTNAFLSRDGARPPHRVGSFFDSPCSAAYPFFFDPD